MTIITMRSDNKSKWESSSSITPALGEICYEEDTNTLKIGDGEHKFKDIPTHFATSKELDELIDNNEGKIRSVVNVNRGYDIVSDKEYYNILEAQKRSTFDRSKFTVVGSPTITADGIASGFSSSNYLGINNINFSTVNSWEIKFKYTSNEGSTPDWSSLFGSINNDGSHNHSIVLFNTGSGTYLYWKLSSDGTDGSLCAKLSPALIKNKSYYITTKFTGIKYIFNIIDENSTSIYNEEIISSTKVCPFASLRIGYNATNKSIDLKQFSITVDGVEVFNGNKTGIDQIKKDDYELKNQVGTVVVDEDRIASGFGGSWDNTGYIKGVTLPATTVTKNIKYTMRFKTPSETPTDLCTIFGINLCWYLGMNADGRLSLAFPNTYFGDTWDNCYSSIVELNTWYDIECGQYIDKNNTVQSYLKWKKSSDNNFKISYAHTSLVTKLFHTSSSSYLLMGSYEYGNLPFIGGSIDLNYTKLIIDDQLVYQPTLRIPYTQSKTGNKIVDATYRDRVQDMYEQFGYTHYYTLGDESEKYNVEVVGSPTLVDGVASGFTPSSYIIKILDNSIPATSNFEIRLKINIATVGSGEKEICCFYNNYLTVPRIDIANKALRFNWTDTSNVIHYDTLQTVSANSTYDIKITNNNHNLKVFVNNIEKLSSDIFNNEIRGLFTMFLSNQFDGSIDLSQFSITVDGKEVFRGYEPTIPNAYTLQTVQNTDIIDFGTTNGITYEQTADLTLTQYGSCENGVVTNILPYKDNNYTVTTPCSSKDKDKFTPSRTGDFIAVGKTVLE